MAIPKANNKKNQKVPFIPTAPQTKLYHSREAIHIVTWYIVDPLVLGNSANDTIHRTKSQAGVTFPPLVELMTTNPCYTDSVERLEFVAPAACVPKSLVEELAKWISTSKTLHQLVLWTVDASIFNNEKELDYMRMLEQAAKSNPNCGSANCSVRMLSQGDPEVLCESLTLTKNDTKTPLGKLRRHLALDGALLKFMSPHDI